ncbi:MAG: hypothetical protein JSS78_07440 [Bacteroidetes bacterium]|nr:hypothetical protein [Bacteroidota bacterium]
MNRLTFFIATTLFFFIGCKKSDSGDSPKQPDQYTKGVVETQTVHIYYIPNLGMIQDTIHNEAYVVGSDYTKHPACELDTFNLSPQFASGRNKVTEYYWSDKSAADLGYSIKDSTGGSLFPFFIPAPCYINLDAANKQSIGINGFFAGKNCGGNIITIIHDRNTKGVIEVRIKSTLNNKTSITIEAYPVGLNYSFSPPCTVGQKIQTNSSFGSVNEFTYFYWTNKTIVELGYTKASSYGFAKSNVIGLVTSNDDSCFTNTDQFNNNITGGKGYWDGFGNTCQ